MQKFKSIATLLVIPAYSVISLASPAIGVATGFQDLTVNKAHVRGNATLFEGNIFATGPDGARISLDGGTSMQLGSSSKGIVYRDRLELLSGSGEIQPGNAYRVDALSLHVKGSAPGAVARVSISGNHLRVGALNGNLQVLNGHGLILATVPEGSATEFTPLAEGASAGPAANSGASAGSSAGASASGASSAGVAGATAGVAAGHTALIIGGVIVAGAGLASGIAVAVASGSSSTLSPSAR